MADEPSKWERMVQEYLRRHSKANIDEYVQTSTFSGNALHDAVRGYIHLEWEGFFYKKLAADATRANIALHGFSVFFKRAAAESIADAIWLEGYLIQRGGRCTPKDIPAPKIEFPDNLVDSVVPVDEALQFEKKLLEDAMRLTVLAS